MQIIFTDDFKKSLSKLPQGIKRLYHSQEERFKKNWHDSRLHTKQIKGLGVAMSFRITRNYRALFFLKNAETAIFFDIDHRKDIYR